MLPLVAVEARPALAVSLLLLGLAGAAGSFQVAAQAMFAASAPAPVRGRVFGLAMAVIAGVQALAAAVAGALAELVEPSLVIAAAGAAGLTFLLCLRPLSPDAGRPPSGRPVRRRAGLPLPAARHRA
jgi:MFS family permease